MGLDDVLPNPIRYFFNTSRACAVDLRGQGHSRPPQPQLTCPSLIQSRFSFIGASQIPGHPIQSYRLVHAFPRWTHKLVVIEVGASDSVHYAEHKSFQLEAGVAHTTAQLIPEGVPSTLVAAISSQVSVMSPIAY